MEKFWGDGVYKIMSAERYLRNQPKKLLQFACTITGVLQNKIL